ncbi:MFS transporter [Chitinibacteraceae bacterium HSL-7]
MNTRQETTLLITLMLVMMLTIVDFMVMMPLSAWLLPELQIDTAAFGWLVSSYSLAAGAASLLAASLADRFDRRHALLFTFTGLTLATLACALASTYPQLLAARTLAGVFGGVIGSVILSIVGDLIPAERRGHAIGWVMMGFSLAAVAGVPAGLLLADLAGWRAPFAALTALSVVLGVVLWYRLPSVRGHLSHAQTSLWQGYRELLSEPNHWWGVSVTAATMLSGFLVIPYIAPSLVANVHLPADELMYIYMAGGAATLLSRPVIARWTDRYRIAKVFAVLVVISFVPIMLISATFQTGLVPQLAIATLFFIFVSGRFIPASALVTGATKPAMRGRLMAFDSAVRNLAGGLAALLAGHILSTGPSGELLHYPAVGVLSCFVGVLAIVLAFRVRTVG